MQGYFLKTDRLTMRIPTTQSLDNWYNLQSDPEVIKYLGDGRTRSKLEIEKNLSKTIKHYHQYNFSFFDIYENNIFIGLAGLFHLEFDEKIKILKLVMCCTKNSGVKVMLQN